MPAILPLFNENTEQNRFSFIKKKYLANVKKLWSMYENILFLPYLQFLIETKIVFNSAVFCEHLNFFNENSVRIRI